MPPLKFVYDIGSRLHVPIVELCTYVPIVELCTYYVPIDEVCTYLLFRHISIDEAYTFKWGKYQLMRHVPINEAYTYLLMRHVPNDEAYTYCWGMYLPIEEVWTTHVFRKLLFVQNLSHLRVKSFGSFRYLGIGYNLHTYVPTYLPT